MKNSHEMKRSKIQLYAIMIHGYAKNVAQAQQMLLL